MAHRHDLVWSRLALARRASVCGPPRSTSTIWGRGFANLQRPRASGLLGRSTLAGVLPDGIRTQLREWVESGGTLIALGSAAAFVADKDVNLAPVRNKQDVLDKLDVYTESLQRESSARRKRGSVARLGRAVADARRRPIARGCQGGRRAESSGTKQVPPAPDAGADRQARRRRETETGRRLAEAL